MQLDLDRLGHDAASSVTFEIGTDPDQATINVNNRVQRATAAAAGARCAARA